MRKKGLTLIEVIISILLFSVVLLGAMAFYFYSDSSFRFAEHKKMALELADARMEQLKAQEYDDLTIGAWDREPIIIGQLPCESPDGLYIDVSDVGGYKLVRVQVVWTDPSRAGTQNITLDTYIAP